MSRLPSNGEIAVEHAALAAAGETSQKPKVLPPENVLRILRPQLGSRDHMHGLQSLSLLVACG